MPGTNRRNKERDMPADSNFKLQNSKSRYSTAVLFAGGKSSRMGEDKSLLPFGGYSTLGEYQYRRLKEIFDKVYISTKSQKFDFEAPLILDRYPQSSPLVGLISLFETISDKECFILSVDAPFVDKTVIEKLYEKSYAGNWDAIIAQSPEGTQPLCGIYRKSILPYAKIQLAEDNHRLGALLKTANSLLVPFDEELSFENLNHPHEYREAVRRSKTQN